MKIQLYFGETYGDDPIYDSEKVTQFEPTIAEDLQKLGDLADLIEDDFLELECEVCISWSGQEEQTEESKEARPSFKIRRGTTLIMKDE